MSNLKTFLLMGVMTFLLMLIGNLIGGSQGVYFAFIFAAFTNFISYWYSDKIVLSMYRAKPVSEDSDVYRIVKNLTARAEMPMPKVYIINESQPNAFATGRNPKHAAVAVTTGLLDIMNNNELAGVIGHELGHIKHRDILIGTIAATFAGAIAFLANMAKWTAIFGGNRDSDEEGGSPIASSWYCNFCSYCRLMLVQMCVSRTREYKADAFGGQISGNPLYLANALRKLEMGVRRNYMDTNPAMENMFIISPLSGDKIASLFSTHPSTQDRIKKLEEMAERGY